MKQMCVLHSYTFSLILIRSHLIYTLNYTSKYLLFVNIHRGVQNRTSLIKNHKSNQIQSKIAKKTHLIWMYLGHIYNCLWHVWNDVWKTVR